MALGILARYWVTIGKQDEGRACAEEAIALAAETGNRWFSGMARQNLALIATLQGAYDEASRHLEASLAILTEMGDRHFANVATSALADIARLSGDRERARLLYRQVMLTWRDFANLGAIARCLECLAFLAMGDDCAEASSARLPSRRAPAGRRSRASPAPCRADGGLRGGRVPHSPGCIAGQAWRSGVCRRVGVSPGLHPGTSRRPRPARFLSSRISRSSPAFFPLFSRSPAILSPSNTEMALASIFRTMLLPDGALKQARRTGQDLREAHNDSGTHGVSGENGSCGAGG